MRNFLQGIHTYIINLDNRPDRWESIQKQIRFLKLKNVERFSAINRTQIDPELFRAFNVGAWRQQRIDMYDEQYIAGTVACIESHLACIRDAKQKGYPEILILEDDAEFRLYSGIVLRKVAKQLKHLNWDVLFLGGRYDRRDGLKKKVSKNLLQITDVIETHAYIIRPSAYDKILQEVPQKLLPIDWYYSTVLQYESTCLALNPMIAFQKINELSDISKKVVPPKRFLKRKRKEIACWIKAIF
jgi:glycosyl transferase family 25